MKRKAGVLILGAGRVCQPAAELLASVGSASSRQWRKTCTDDGLEEMNDVHVIVASLYLKDAEEVRRTFFLFLLNSPFSLLFRAGRKIY